MYEALLAQVPLFADLSPRELTWLSGACRERTYAPGEALVRAGEGPSGLFLLRSGRVQVSQPQPDGGELSVGQLGPGAVLGERALLEAVGVSLEMVKALEATVALVLPRWDFQATLRESPDIAIKLLAVLSRQMDWGNSPNY